MSSNVLHAWICGAYVGRFERAATALNPHFVYAANAETDISLSLKQGEQPSDLAARNYLDGLLPENQAAREQIRIITAAESSNYWDLLTAIGGDLQGGVVLHPDEDGPARIEGYASRAFEEDVADRIQQIHRGGTGYVKSGPPPRFSLAGAQSKFALARTTFGDFWSDAATPSTHILKPESADHSGLELIECATIQLAKRVGLRVTDARQEAFAGETTYIIERFDRNRNSDGTVSRTHSEDMVQALGRPTSEKYLVHTDDVVRLLRDNSGSDELGYEFYRQYAFNSIIGNADAHGKNYSIQFDGRDITLSPLYDSIPIVFFAQYDQALAMPVGWTDQFVSVTPSDWIESAEDSGLDPDRVSSTVREVAAGVQEHVESTLGVIDHPRVSRVGLDQILRAAARQSGAA
ncbi:MAG: HipA domain-containing protein [Gulosibacter sp.]|uniref:HipA domain-containing protein n=1 Tax=Gulosibacter sp. TaxID=2817531 RepID=UPI003F8E7128